MSWTGAALALLAVAGVTYVAVGIVSRALDRLLDPYEEVPHENEK